MLEGIGANHVKKTEPTLVERLRERILIRQFQRGSSDAFLALVRLYEERLLYFIRRFERDPERALDALQDVWLMAWKMRLSLRSPGAFRAWLYRIAHGKIVDAIRRESRRHRAEQQRPVASTNTTDGVSALLEAAELVHFALARLSPEHREVLTLRFLEGMTIAEIATATNCPNGTVKSRLHYASQEILTLIAEQHNDCQ
ncbi:ECF RNA polymerase sigma factor SigW [Caulifigura coniformis]|uniref:ECF RNA polymerase sigma factor SigW n=1 Tax=Caulifigura coniformis TaxID=2527983 RepID=A0A517S7F8_9PLAN|nr:sigma-70 family RNA polymerase sigma factor [Caulifigura coniformis]QDT52064.1 ECF RNA polymerase sigma factor SigW [Caulifigura coniformis]